MKFFLLKGTFVLLCATAALSATVANKPKAEARAAEEKMEAKPQMAAKETMASQKAGASLKQENGTTTVKPPKRVIKPKPEASTNVTRFAFGSCKAANLCCPGRIDGCITFTACYCDEFCMENGDCCSDYTDYCQGKFRCWEVDTANGNPCNKIDAGAVCEDSAEDPTKMTCTCSSGYVFTSLWNSCALDVCSSSHCTDKGDSGAYCQINEDLTTYKCVCNEGFSGPDCTPDDLCANAMCGDNLVCDAGSGSCVCAQGFVSAGEGVCVPADLCASVSCGENFVCDAGNCVCASNFFLSIGGLCLPDPCVSADSVDSNPCNNGGDSGSVCVPDYLGSVYTCTCSEGYGFSNDICAVIDACATVICPNNSICENGLCGCALGFFISGSGACLADACVSGDDSDSNPCNNNGDQGSTCLPNYYDGTFRCQCSDGWVLNGDSCLDPCQGVDCGAGGYCSLGSCVCEFNYFLFEGRCYQDPCLAVDGLDGNPCNNNGNTAASCLSDYSTNTYSCSCSDGWVSTNGSCIGPCSLNDEGDANPCNDLGDLESACYPSSSSKKSYACACSPGWIFNGASCAGACALADSEDGNPCNNNGDSCASCNLFGDSYGCECSEGFKSVNGVCVDIDECQQPYVCNDCGSCRNTNGGFFCICGQGYRVTDDGKNCESLLSTWLNVLGVKN